MRTSENAQKAKFAESEFCELRDLECRIAPPRSARDPDQVLITPPGIGNPGLTVADAYEVGRE
jgi:hypothetical protein